MATTTTYLSLRKPATSDTVSVTTDISNNMDAIDSIMVPVAASTQAIGDAASAGSASTVARTDHVHGLPNWGSVTNLTGSSSNGVATTPARSDHKHSFGFTSQVAGDTFYATSATALSRLALGSAYALLRTNSGATAPEWGSAGQIHFPATQNASADANDLDDYEEGTWTLSLGGNTTYTSRQGNYTKTGNVVHVWGAFVINAIGTGSTSTISGLPFTAAAFGGNDYAGSTNYWKNLVANTISIAAWIPGSGSTVKFDGSAASSASSTNNLAIFGSGTEISFQITYFV